MKHLEIELKTLLKKEEYDHLKNSFPYSTRLSENYYIDTPDFQLREKGLPYAFRTFLGLGQMTLKVPQTVGKYGIQPENQLFQKLNRT